MGLFYRTTAEYDEKKHEQRNKTRSVIVFKCQALRTSRAFSDRQVCQFLDTSNAIRCSMWFFLPFFHSIELVLVSLLVFFYSSLDGYLFSRVVSLAIFYCRCSIHTYVGIRVLPQICVVMIILASLFKRISHSSMRGNEATRSYRGRLSLSLFENGLVGSPIFCSHLPVSFGKLFELNLLFPSYRVRSSGIDRHGIFTDD